MSAKIVDFGPKKIAGYKISCSMDDGKIADFWKEIFDDGRHKKLHEADFFASHDEYGVCKMTGETTMDYIIGREVKEAALVPSEFTIVDLPKGDYLYITTNPSDRESFATSIQKGWQDFHVEIEKLEYTFASYLSFELYSEKNMSDSSYTCEIYAEVTKK